ncbi:unnamed protein product, partial [Brassica rapa]
DDSFESVTAEGALTKRLKRCKHESDSESDSTSLDSDSGSDMERREEGRQQRNTVEAIESDDIKKIKRYSKKNEKQQLPKKEDANSGGQNQKRDVDNVESMNLKNNYKGASSGKKASRVSDDSDTEGRKHIREEAEDYNHTMEGTCIDDDAGQRRGTVKDGYIISIIWICIEVEPAVKKIMTW